MNMKRKGSYIFITMLLMILSITAMPKRANAAAKLLTSAQVANYFNIQVGKSYPSGYCLKFIADSFANLGAVRSSACCASRYGSTHIVSSNISNIPVGADVYFGNCGGGPCGSCGSRYFGHIGVYVGNGMFVHATNGRVQKTSLTGSNWRTKYRGWGWHSNVNVSGTASASANSQSKAVISNVSIKNIDSDNVTFSWNTTGKRSVVVVTCGKKSWKSGFYTSSNPTCTFYRKSIPGCTKSVQIRIYSYTNSGSANTPGQGECCHLMTYGTMLGYVNFPDQAPKGYVEVTPNNMIAQGKFTGWVISETAIDSVKVTINGTTYNARLSNRADVKKAYPTYSYVKGWSLSLTPYEVKDGNNSYKITANFADGKSYTVQTGTFRAEKLDCLFDPVYFKAKYYRDSNVSKLTTDAQLERYYYHNLNKSYDPSMLFSPVYYTGSANADLNKKGWSGIQSYEHFVHYGIKSGKEYRATSEFVNLSYLHTHYSDLKKKTPEELLQWASTWGLKYDQRLLANSNAAKAFRKFYNCSEYASLNADLLHAFSKPVAVAVFGKTNAEKYWRHLWTYGIMEKRNTSKSFNVKTYLKNAKINSNSSYQIFSHYISTGYSKKVKTK